MVYGQIQFPSDRTAHMDLDISFDVHVLWAPLCRGTISERPCRTHVFECVSRWSCFMHPTPTHTFCFCVRLVSLAICGCSCKPNLVQTPFSSGRAAHKVGHYLSFHDFGILSTQYIFCYFRATASHTNAHASIVTCTVFVFIEPVSGCQCLRTQSCRCDPSDWTAALTFPKHPFQTAMPRTMKIIRRNMLSYDP